MSNAILEILNANKISNADRIFLWDAHDAIVNHAKNDTIPRQDAFAVLRVLSKRLPVMLSRRGEDELGAYTEFMHLGIDEASGSGDRLNYVWASTFIYDTQYLASPICIADERSEDELIALIDKFTGV